MLLFVGSVANLAANVALAEPTAMGRVIAAWPSFALITSYELLMRQVRLAADASMPRQRPGRPVCGQRPDTDAASASGPLPGRQAEVLAWQ